MAKDTAKKYSMKLTPVEQSVIWAYRRKKQDGEQRLRLEELITEIVEVTDDCRFNMHEPDEQDLYADVIGGGLDNACVAPLHEENLSKTLSSRPGLDYIDMTIALFRVGDAGNREHLLNINVADLIAAVRYLDGLRPGEGRDGDV